MYLRLQVARHGLHLLPALLRLLIVLIDLVDRVDQFLRLLGDGFIGRHQIRQDQDVASAFSAPA